MPTARHAPGARSVVRTDWLRWSSEECCTAGAEGRNARGPALVVRGRRARQLPAERIAGPMTPTGLPQWNVITSTGAVSGAVARDGGGAHGSVDLPPWSPGPRDRPRWHRPRRGWRNGVCSRIPSAATYALGRTTDSGRRNSVAPAFPGTAAEPPPRFAPARIQWASDGRRSSPDVRVPRTS